jgi:hypothetical protein
MADVAPRRINLQVEETKHKAGVSEATFTRTAQAVNFVNMKQYDSRGFFLNGPYFAGDGKKDVDGAWIVLFDIEIIGVAMFNHVAGTSGTTRLDVHRFTASGTPAGGTSIFTTRPALSFSSGNNAMVVRDVLNSVTLQGPSGSTVPVLSITDLNAGDMLSLDLDNAQPGGENCGLILYYRPR